MQRIWRCAPLFELVQAKSFFPVSQVGPPAKPLGNSQNGDKMKNKIRFILVGCLALVGLILVRVYFVAAQETTLKDVLRFDSSVPITSGEVTEDYSNSIPAEAKDKARNDDVLQEAERIIRKSESIYLTAGWLHISSVTESFAPASMTLPDGSPSPTKWTNESWVRLDDNGNAIKAVSVQDTGNPTLYQVSVFEESIWTNVTLGSSSSEPETYRPTLDSGFLSSVASYKDSIILDQYSEISDGKDVVVFVATGKYKNPIKILQDTEDKKATELTSVVNKYYFSVDTGLPLQVENYFASLDGNMELSQRISKVFVEKIDSPPDFILSYFSK